MFLTVYVNTEWNQYSAECVRSRTSGVRHKHCAVTLNQRDLDCLSYGSAGTSQRDLSDTLPCVQEENKFCTE